MGSTGALTPFYALLIYICFFEAKFLFLGPGDFLGAASPPKRFSSRPFLRIPPHCMGLFSPCTFVGFFCHGPTLKSPPPLAAKRDRSFPFFLNFLPDTSLLLANRAPATVSLRHPRSQRQSPAPRTVIPVFFSFRFLFWWFLNEISPSSRNEQLLSHYV